MRILADGNYEVKWKMYTLLSRKGELMSETDKLGCINILREEMQRLEEALGCMEDILYNIFMYEDWLERKS